MERYGRRWPLIIGGIWQSVWLFAYASVGVTRDTADKGTGNFLIVATVLFIFGYSSTWAPGIWILTGETFPVRTRQKQAGIAVASNWIWVIYEVDRSVMILMANSEFPPRLLHPFHHPQH